MSILILKIMFYHIYIANFHLKILSLMLKYKIEFLEGFMRFRNIFSEKKQIIVTSIFILFVITITLSCLSVIYIQSKHACWGRLASHATITEVKTRSLIYAYENSLKSIASVFDSSDSIHQSNYLKKIQNIRLYDLHSPVRIYFKNKKAVTEDQFYDDVSEFIDYDKIESTEPYVTLVYKDPFHPENMITEVRTPIICNNEIIGMAASVVDLKKLEKFISEASAPGNAYVYLLDRRDDTLFVDTEHKEIINIHNFENRTPVKGYSSKTFLEDIYHCRPSKLALHSLSDNKVKFFYSVPSSVQDISVIIGMNKENLFQDMTFIRKVFISLIVTVNIAFIFYLIILTKITRKQFSEQNFEYSEIAKALSNSFDCIYFVNIVNDTFKIFNEHATYSKLNLKIECKDFFKESLNNISKVVHENDIELVRQFIDKRSILNKLKTGEVVSQVYRLMIENTPVYYRMKVMKLISDSEHIVVATENVNDEVLREHEEQLRSIKIIQALSDNFETIYYVDSNSEKYETHSVNPEFTKSVLTQITQGENFFDDVIVNTSNIVVDDDRVKFLEYFNRSYFSTKLTQDSDINLDIRLLISNTPVWYRIKAVLIKDANNNSKYIIGLKNILNEKKKEIEISRNSEIIKILASEYSAVFYIDLDTEDVIPYSLNEYTISNFGRYFKTGVKYSEAFENFVNTNISPSDREAMLKLASTETIKSILQKQKSYNTTYLGYNDGIAHYCEIKIVKFGDEKETPVGVAIGFSDRDDEILAHYVDSKLYQDYFGIYFVNLDTDSVRIIKQDLTNNISNFKSNELFLPQMASYTYYIDPKFRDDVVKFCNKQYLSDFFINEDKREYTYQTINGLWHRCTGFVVERESNLPKNIILAFMNIDNASGQKIELTEKISEQKKALEEQQILLEQALVKANAASSAKTAFLSNMSHDIRTPMNAITGFTNLALEHINETEKVKNYLEKVATSSNHLLSLINDVLDMSRIEAGKIMLDLEPENLLNIINYIKDILTPEISLKQQNFIINTDELIHQDVVCDRLRLNRVLLNIISNSIKYTQKNGSISITVSEQDSTKENYKRFTFIIEDNGMGMNEEFLKTIFEPFTRERNSTVSGIQGTGLGMAITKNLIDIMNGTINIESHEHKGTKTTICLELQLSDNNTAINDKALETTEKISFSGTKILLVDDNDFNREIANLILTDEGIIVEEATNGLEAVEKIASSKPGSINLILMDIQMPGMNGYEAAKNIRALENKELSEIPIIAMTANAFEEDRALAFSAGMNEHISKPLNLAKLMEVLGKFLKKE